MAVLDSTDLGNHGHTGEPDLSDLVTLGSGSELLLAEVLTLSVIFFLISAALFPMVGLAVAWLLVPECGSEVKVILLSVATVDIVDELANERAVWSSQSSLSVRSTTTVAREERS